VIAFLQTFHVTPLQGNDTGGLMAQERGQAMPRTRRPLHGMNLGVAHTAGKKLDQHLIRPRIGKFNFVYDQWFLGLYEDCRQTSCAHVFS
jgi:hypothetical protein